MKAPFWGTGGLASTNAKGGELALHVERNLLCSVVVGHFDQALADQIMRRGTSLADECGKIIVFSDWYRMSSYESSCRSTMTSWGVGLGPRLLAFHVTAGAGMVKMGLSVARILVPSLHLHSSPAAFVAAYQAEQRLT
ncbi:MAG: hypothetical protein QM756_46400 [Polyangiaceae bacterium]